MKIICSKMWTVGLHWKEFEYVISCSELDSLKNSINSVIGIK